MSWIGLRDGHDGWFKADPRLTETGADRVLHRGSLMVETRMSAEARPQTLLGFRRTWPMPGRFSIQALPQGGIVLVDAQGDDICHATLPVEGDGRMDILRLTYSWDSVRRWARLTLERPESDQVHSVEMTATLPLPLDDLNAIFAHGCNFEVDEEVTFLALSDRIEPVGPLPALTAQVPILTDAGERPVAEIRRGDIVVTDEGLRVPVLQAVKRTVPARGSFRPIRLRAPFFKLTRDIVVSPQQRLVMHGSEVEYMFGREAVLVPARYLLNDRSAFHAKGPDLVTYHHLLLPGHEAVLAAGCALESLYIGRMRRKPEATVASVLAAFDRNRLPEHAKPVWPVLKPFEAVTLATSRAA